ncbi:hypothetical protein IWQ56_002713 [Coemansia nantahalensis]|uniref:Uncharacterized protein n=1 Tax=Coemansia nantahalensis TaxID=2789366 RepID=A0ACC1JZZ5_9FUNG|nr:hypothetical protein IWQ56_002713 [Coemansia nantahalensis]KAJ2770635.1 hypothetical protein IWQ57_002572 [Coemansia nantahalensis]
MAIGKIVHVGIDLVLLSTALAGIRRTTGLRVNPDNVTDSKSIGNYLDSYLSIGEKTLDLAAWQMSQYPSFFTKDK